ncbi:MAG: xanthine dehydrogenase family protein subunit M [Acidobacteria bacterium]|nr:xanthine dehydrogenase family protein subunit M [Acidobacteriota bacterium]
MFPASFDYHRAGSTQEALDLLARFPDAKLMAGGHSLLPMMKLRLAQPPAVIDIGRIGELSGIELEGGTIRVGAGSRHAEIAASETLKEHCPILAEAAAHIGDPQVRNRGTLGGNIAHADPASDLPAVLVALDATIDLLGAGGERQVQAGDFFKGLLSTDLGEGEILTAVHVPFFASGTGTAYLKAEHPASGYAVCGAAAVVSLSGGKCTGASLAFNGVAETPVSAGAVTAALVGTSLDDAAIDAAIASHLSISDPLGDVYASGEYRVQLARVYGARALKAARDRA